MQLPCPALPRPRRLPFASRIAKPTTISPLLLMVHPSVPARSVKEFIAFAKARPGELSFATSGPSGTGVLAGELFKSATGIQLTHVPYRGSPQAIQDLMGGRVDFMFDQTFPMILSGKLRALAVSSDQRSALLPDVPTLAESGLKGFKVLSWHAIYAPAGTPKAIITRLNASMEKALATDETRNKLGQQGMQVVGGSPQMLADLTRAEVKRWAQVVEESGAKLD